MLTLIGNWLLGNLFFFWLVIAIFFLMLEMGSPGLFFFLSFFFGALLCAFVTFFTNSVMVQTIMFLIGTVVSFLFLHFWIKSKIFKKDRDITTNVYAMLGKQGTVVKRISASEVGQVKLFGDIWMARSAHDEVMEKGDEVIVVKLKGAHVVVRPKSVRSESQRKRKD